MAEGRKSFSDIAHMSTLAPEEIADEETYEEVYDEAEDTEVDSVDEAGEEAEAAEGTVVADADSYESKKEDVHLEHTEPKYIVAARPSREDIFRFLMAHTYMNIIGIIAIVIGVGAIALVIVSLAQSASLIQTVLLAAVAAMFILNSPVSLYFKAKKQAARMEDEANVITYTFSSVGFDMLRADEYASYRWDKLERVREGQTAIYMYLTKNQAFLLPKQDLGESLEPFKTLIKDHVDPKKYTLKS